MPTVNGTLKSVALAKSEKGYNLKGDWDDGKEWQYVEASAAKVLADEGIVVRDGQWPDSGKPKYRITGEPHIGIITTFHGKGNPPTHQIVLNGQKEPESATTDPTSKSPVLGASWEEVEHDYQAALDIAIRAWERVNAKAPEDAVLQAAAATVFIEANKRGIRGVAQPQEASKEPPALDDFPEGLVVDEGDESDSLPF